MGINANILNLNEEEVSLSKILTWMICECINVWIMSYYFINGVENGCKWNRIENSNNST